MGQGQSDIAMQQLRECSQNGEWLCLKNLHLVTAWLPVLEKVCSNEKFYNFIIGHFVKQFQYLNTVIMNICIYSISKIYS